MLGLWLGPAGGEGAQQWATMLTELRNRGLQDALIVCCDAPQAVERGLALKTRGAADCGLRRYETSIRYTSPSASVAGMD